jgi:hypothetical protein
MIYLNFTAMSGPPVLLTQAVHLGDLIKDKKRPQRQLLQLQNLQHPQLHQLLFLVMRIPMIWILQG